MKTLIKLYDFISLLKSKPLNSVTALYHYSYKNYNNLISKNVSTFMFKEVSCTNISTRNIFLTKISYAKSRDKVKEKKKPKQVKIDVHESSDVIDTDELIADMNRVIENMKSDFIQNLTVRSNSGSIEQLSVKFDGKNYQIQELAQIARKPKLIVLNVAAFPASIPFIIKAIEKSGLNINPQQEGTTLYLPIPKVTKEHRENLSKNAKAIFIIYRDQLKEIKNKAIKTIKKRTGVSEDAVRRIQSQLETICNKYIKEAETVLKTKQEELVGSND